MSRYRRWRDPIGRSMTSSLVRLAAGAFAVTVGSVLTRLEVSTGRFVQAVEAVSTAHIRENDQLV